MEDPNNQLSMFSGKTELVLDEPPASVTMMLGGNSEKAEQLAAHRLQMASIRKQYPHILISRFFARDPAPLSDKIGLEI